MNTEFVSPQQNADSQQWNSLQAMASDVSQNVEILVLGRPLRLGTLYNYHTDTVVPGFNLLDQNELIGHVVRTPTPKIVRRIIKNDGLSQRAKALDMDDADQLKFYLDKNIHRQISGAAAVLGHEPTSDAVNRTILRYTCTTESEELNMAHLASAQGEHVEEAIKHLHATHVVVRITHGADAFFVLENDADHASNTNFGTAKTREMDDAVTKLHSVQRHEDVTHDVYDIPSAEIKCRYYGDFKISSTPQTYEEAAKMILDIPKLLEDNGNTVPKSAVLQPLYAFCPSMRKTRLVAVDDLLVKDAGRVLEDLRVAVERTEILLQHDALRYFPSVKRNLEDFLDIVDRFRVTFRNDLVPYKQDVSVEAADQDSLRYLVEDIGSTRFKGDILREWLNKKTEEVTLLAILLKKPHILTQSVVKIVKTEDEFRTVLFDTDFENYMRFELRLCEELEQYVKDLKTELDIMTQERRRLTTTETVNPFHGLPEYWFEDIRKRMQLKVKLENFLALAEANKNNQKCGFVLGVAKFRPQAPQLYKIWLHNLASIDGFSDNLEHTGEEITLPLAPEMGRILQLTGFDDQSKETPNVEAFGDRNA